MNAEGNLRLLYEAERVKGERAEKELQDLKEKVQHLLNHIDQMNAAIEEFQSILDKMGGSAKCNRPEPAYHSGPEDPAGDA